MIEQPFNTEAAHNIKMSKNPFSKMENFAEFATDKNMMKIFLLIAKNRRRYVNELVTDTGMMEREVICIVDKLESGNFIEKNPNPESRKYKLGFNGQLFAEQLKLTYPEIKEYLGNENLIEPIK